MSTAKPPKMAAKAQNTELPFDVIIAHILPRLPVKSLLKLKCVSREWYSGITCRNFAKSYLRHPFSLSSTSVLTHTFAAVGPIGNIFEIVDYTDPNNLVRTQFEINSKHSFICLSASCNGLVFLISSPSEPDNFNLPDDLHHFNFEYVVFNPAVDVNSLAVIPHPPQFSFSNNDSYTFGFGYVDSPDDYYIVAMNLINSKVVVYVYSLKSQQWQSPRNFNILMQFQEPWYSNSGTLVNETLHWGVTQSEKRKRIAAYNLNNLDDIQFMHLPYADFGSGTECFPDFSLGCIEGCLCAWARYGDGEVAEMWMLKDYYGLPHNWTKLFRLHMIDDYPSCFFGFTASKIGLILSSNIHELLLTDFSRDPPEYQHTGINENHQVVNYVQSLESIPFPSKKIDN